MSTHTVAAFIKDLTFEALPEKVVVQVKRAVMDHLGVMLAAVDDKAVLAARQFARRMGGAEESTLIGTAVKAPCNLAALVNAIMARTLDMDDGAYRATGHLAHAGGVVVPSALSVAECRHASGRQLIEAVAASYEVTLRAGWLISLWKVFAPAGMAGTYGAAAGAAKLFQLDTPQIQDALGVAEAHCLYPSKAKRFDKMTMTKEAAGWGAMTGVSAAMLAQEGFNGPETLFDLPEWNKEPLETLGREWEIMGLYFKPYCCCRFTHAPLDGVFELMRKHELSADAISEITVGIAFAAAVTLFGNYRPANIWQAQFSLPFTLGAALADGKVGPEQIAEGRLADQRILAAADKVKIVEDKEVGALAASKGMRSCRIRITAKDGSEFETFVGYPRGAPENPLSDDELTGKFLELAAQVIGPDRAQETLSCLQSLEELDDVSTLVKGMCRTS